MGDELRCVASTTCISGSAFCLFCDGRSLEVCACQNACTPMAAGSPRGYDTSDDTGVSGTCGAGKCNAQK